MIEGRFITAAAAASAGIDLARCSFVMLQVGLYEHEQAALQPGANSADWPEPVRRLVSRELLAWRERNRGRAIVCTHSYAIARQCVVELYHVDPIELAPANATQAGTASAPRVPVSAAPPDCAKCGE